ncbi:hypothetical protein CASFOL_004367 [Castilleja foliolosa]|uniref:Uncharacterized protein n=1 Tax=Castilleja foliolosa TaxID=1961234 RepID=A0ABD3EAA6_9LAMI
MAATLLRNITQNFSQNVDERPTMIQFTNSVLQDGHYKVTVAFQHDTDGFYATPTDHFDLVKTNNAFPVNGPNAALLNFANSVFRDKHYRKEIVVEENAYVLRPNAQAQAAAAQAQATAAPVQPPARLFSVYSMRAMVEALIERDPTRANRLSLDEFDGIILAKLDHFSITRHFGNRVLFNNCLPSLSHVGLH